MKSKSYHSSKNKVKYFRDNITFIEEDWFADMDLTDGATFPTALIKFSKSRFNQKIFFHMTQRDAFFKLK